MKAKLATSFVFVLVLALSLTTTARPGGKSLPRSASPAADRDDRKSDRDKAKEIFGDHEGDACRNNDELVEESLKTPLEVVGVIPIPGPTLLAANPMNLPPVVTSLAFDITWADPITEQVYTSDRTNRTLDIIDAENNLFKGQVPGFVGAPAGGCTLANAGTYGAICNGLAGGGTTISNDKGPNGAVTFPGWVAVGDGNSSVQFVQNNPAFPGYLTIAQTLSTNLPACDGGTATTHYCERADEEGYDPKDKLLLILNDEPQSVTAPHGAIDPYGNWIDVSSVPFKVVGTFTFPGAGGAEQPVWDPGIGEFIITVPGTATQQSEIAYVKPLASSIDPKPLALGDLTGTGATCSGANGLALGANQHAVASACGGVVIFNVVTRKLINFDATDVAPGDEVWANNGDSRFYVAGADKHFPIIAPATTQPSALGVFDQQSGKWLQNVDANGVSNVTAFAETNTIISKAGGTRVGGLQGTTNLSSVCAANGDNGTGCFVIFRHAGFDTDKP